jgi:hemolysin III
MPPYQATIYGQKEERFNIWSHGVGFVASLVGTILLLLKTQATSDLTYTVSAAVYGTSLLTLYAASTLYHSAKKPKLRNRLNIFDHAAIYVLIAGTYTPFCLITLTGEVGWILFGCVWSFALVGVILKLFFTGRYDKLSTLMYVFMGCMVLFAFRPLMANLPTEGLYWLLGGGISYIIGAVFYSFPQRIRYNHAIFHVFVLAGSLCHFVSVYCWVFSIQRC